MRSATGIFLVVWASLAQAADLSVRVQGAPAEGMLVFQVYDSPNAFGDFRNPVKEIRAPIQPDGLYQISDIRAGDIAVLVYVDENENSLLDKNFIGIPKERLESRTIIAQKARLLSAVRNSRLARENQQPSILRSTRYLANAAVLALAPGLLVAAVLTLDPIRPCCNPFPRLPTTGSGCNGLVQMCNTV